jgi:hypothetical protein
MKLIEKFTAMPRYPRGLAKQLDEYDLQKFMLPRKPRGCVMTKGVCLKMLMMEKRRKVKMKEMMISVV